MDRGYDSPVPLATRHQRATHASQQRAGEASRRDLNSKPEKATFAAMRRLLILRHSKTERPEPGEHDRVRKLTKRGRADAPLIGAYMAHHGLVPDVALVSPATRAEETWALIAKALPQAPRVVKEEGIYNAGRDKLISIIRKAPDAHVLLVVGHNPGLHELAVSLI